MKDTDWQNTWTLIEIFATWPWTWVILLVGTFIVGSFIHWLTVEIQWQKFKKETDENAGRFR